jgi:hypothetical protein
MLQYPAFACERADCRGCTRNNSGKFALICSGKATGRKSEPYLWSVKSFIERQEMFLRRQCAPTRSNKRSPFFAKTRAILLNSSWCQPVTKSILQIFIRTEKTATKGGSVARIYKRETPNSSSEHGALNTEA